MMALNEFSDHASYLKLVKLHTAILPVRRYPHPFQPQRLKCVERILKQDGDINFRTPDTVMLKSRCSKLVGCTILHLHFCDDNLANILNLLLDHGADFTIKTPDGQTIIHEYINMVSCKLREDCWYSPVRSPCIASVLSAHLKRQITENPVDPNGLSHFHAACMTNNVEAIEFFLDNGVSVQQRVNEDSPVFPGYTALHFATRFDCLKTVKLLLLRGAKVDAQDAKKMTPLHVIISNILSHGEENIFSLEECFYIIGDITDNDKNVNAQDHLGFCDLHTLCIFEDSPMLERHLNNIGDVNHVVNADSPLCPGFTPLHFAAMFNPDNFKLLLAKGGDITIKDAQGKTALDSCIARYGIEVIHDILARSAFKDVTLSNGKTKLTDLIYSMRSLSHFKTLLQELGDANAHIPVDSHLWPGHTPLHLAIVFQDEPDEQQREMLVQMTEECLKSGVDVHAKGLFDQTLLQFAFRHGQEEVVDLMLKYHRGTSNPVDIHGLSHLHIACAAKNKNVVEKLLANGADINCKLGSTFTWYRECYIQTQTPLPEGSTPLHVAVAVGELKMVKLLLQRGADLQARDADGMSAVHRLMLSSVDMRYKLLDELLSFNNLRECVVESCGLSHLHVACYRKHLDAVKRLLFEPEVQVNAAISCKASDEYSLLNYNHQTPLHMAMRVGNDEKSIETVKLLLQHGADILAHGDWQRAPLLSVLTDFEPYLDCYWDLFVAKIRSDEDLHRRVFERVPGLTDLHLACYGRNLRWTGELLAMGVDVNARIRDDSQIWTGYTPLHVLMKKRYKKPDTILQLLLDNGADVAVPAGYDFNTPLHLAENCLADICLADDWIYAADRFCTPEATESENSSEETGVNCVKQATSPEVPCDRARLMLRSIKDFTSNPTNFAGVSHFHVACWCLDVVAVEEFLKQGVDVNAKLDYFYDFMAGYTPLHVTLTREGTSASKVRIVELLLEHGADVRAESYSGNTALHYAAMYQANVGLPIFEMILKAGADINAKNVLGASPLEILLKEGKVGIEWMKYFIERGCRINDFNCVSDEGLIPMIFAAGKLKEQDVKTSLLNSPKMREIDEMGRSAIHNIVSIYSLDERGLAKSMSDIDEAGFYFISPTVDKDDYAELIEELEKLGHDVDRQDKSGQTALHTAARFQNFSAIAALLAVGADVNVVDGAGKTAFAYSLLEHKVYKSHPFGYWSEYDDAFSERAIELFAAHVNKLRLADLHVDAFNEDSKKIALDKHCRYVSMMDTHRFRAIISSIDDIKVGSQSLTLRDFVSANGPVWKYSKLRRMDRDHVVELFDTILDKRYEEKLGELRCLVKLQYRNYLARPKLVEDAKSALSVFANIPVPDLCSDAILAFCANWELRNVIGATN